MYPFGVVAPPKWQLLCVLGVAAVSGYLPYASRIGCTHYAVRTVYTHPAFRPVHKLGRYIVGRYIVDRF